MKTVKKAKDLRTIDDLKKFLEEFFKGKEVKVYLFGSRAKGENTVHSDIDLALESKEDINKDIVLLKEILEESYLPYKVDIINLKNTPYLKKIVKKEGKRWL